MDEDLVSAINKLLTTRANRFLNNSGYRNHAMRCVRELNFGSLEEAFLFGGLDAMQQDFASGNQMTLPPKSPIDASHRDNRFDRLKYWKQNWQDEGRLPWPDA